MISNAMHHGLYTKFNSMSSQETIMHHIKAFAQNLIFLFYVIKIPFWKTTLQFRNLSQHTLICR